MRHIAKIPVRWGDLDALGHVNNVALVQLLEEALVSLITELGWTGETHALGFYVVRHEIDYIAPIMYRIEPLTVEVWVDHIGTSSWTLSYDVLDHEGQPLAHARTVLVTIDLETSRPRPLDGETLEHIKRFYEPISLPHPAD